MAIRPAPKPGDSKGKCTRWRVMIYNRHAHKYEWHTVGGGKKDAQVFERQQKEKLRLGTYIPRAARKTFGELATIYLQNLTARGRRTSTIGNVQSVLDCHLLPKLKDHKLEVLQQRACWTEHFNQMEANPKISVELINRCIRVAKAMMYFAFTENLIERTPLARFPMYEAKPGSTSRRVNRRALTEVEIRAVLDACQKRPQQRLLFATLVLTGIRPGEAYALRCCDVDLEGGTLRIARNYDHRGKQFTAPKTDAGVRLVPLAGWLVTELKAHLERTGRQGEELLFATRTGQPLNPTNVLQRGWYKALDRAQVPRCDLYSLRHTFASLARSSGESSFNTARIMGHTHSRLVDAVYAHSLPSGLASVAASVAARALGEKPQLRVIESGKSPEMRQPLDTSLVSPTDEALTG